MRYSPERKEAVLRKMLPPHNRSIPELAEEEGISEGRHPVQLAQGRPGRGPPAARWRPEED